MIKTNFLMLILLLPVIFNSLMIMLLMMPSKNNFHPMSMMIILIILIILMTIKMNIIFYTWMSFILFLAMIGGLMIIFMYITSLVNNEFFKMKFYMIMLNIIKIMPLIFIILIMYYYLPINFFTIMNIQDSWKINLYMIMNDQLNIMILYNKINNISSYFIMLYIFYSMICIMNICYKLKIPLRQLMY